MRFGTIMVALVAGLLSAGWPVRAQDEALARALEDLEEANRQYKELSNQINKEAEELVGQVEQLDYRVLDLSKKLRKLQGEEALVTKEKQQLNDELEMRDKEFEYLFKNFDQYISQLVNSRLHVAESQIYEEKLQEIERAGERAGDDLVAGVEASAPMLTLGVNRLLDLAGGYGFAGKAAGPGNQLKTGSFALFGPIGFFASDDGDVAGMTAFKAGDVNIPSIHQMDPEPRGKVKSFVESGEGTVPVDASLGKAFQIEEGKKSLREFLKAGGVVGYVILLFGLLAAGLALFKLIEIMKFRVPTRGEVNEILDQLLAGEEKQAVEKASGLTGLAGRVVEAGARHFTSKRRVMEDALFEKLSAVQPRLERLLPFLAVIAAAAPMAGLLGTVLGIMKTFEMMAQFGTGDAKYTAGGIGEALITTFLGLVVAIPTIMVHGVLKSYARSRLGQVEGIALAMINGTTELTKEDEGAKREDAPKRGSRNDDDDEEDLVEDALIEPA